MQPMAPYLLGEEHPEGTRISNSQKCIRTIDIDEVGDTFHLTLFEMIGNWSLGDYFKKEQIGWIFEFWTKEIGFDPDRIYVSVFGGNDKYDLEKDSEAVGIWKEEFKKVGIEANDMEDSENKGMRDGRIFYYGDDNWWSRIGKPDNMPVGEPGGPDSEMFYDLGGEKKIHENSIYKDKPCHVNCDCGRFIEIGNNVFMEFKRTESGFESLPKKNIDFGGGFERIVMISQGKDNVYETDLFSNIIFKIEQLSGKKFSDTENQKSMRIIADHLKTATFIMGDAKGIVPSNTDQGYIVRRLVRRAIRHGRQLGIESDEPWTKEVAKIVVHDYHEVYPELRENVDRIVDNLKEEELKFSKTLEKGLKKIEKIIKNEKEITAINAFDLYQTYGFPIEMTEELASEKNIKINKDEFEKELKKHQKLSKTASVGKFKGGLADNSEETTKLHTAAHLLLASLRKVLGDHVVQKGSNITAERLRFDFSHGEKMTNEQKQEVEDMINKIIKEDVFVSFEEMDLAEAKESGAMGVFESKYDEKVKVYKVGEGNKLFSYEICGGPHVERTGMLGIFKIKKEGSSSAGVRRIKAMLE
jgi:alanyl-tRNA synthetase